MLPFCDVLTRVVAFWCTVYVALVVGLDPIGTYVAWVVAFQQSPFTTVLNTLLYAYTATWIISA